MHTSNRIRRGAIALSLMILLAPTTTIAGDEAPAKPQFSMGNGTANAIVIDGFTRDGRAFTFPEVKIDGDGWLVLHPFRDGKPVGEIYVGATFVKGGTNRDVTVNVQTAPMPEPGTKYLVMLHRDVNNDETFDFVFVDERNVKDKAVFEGTMMIAHVIAAQ